MPETLDAIFGASKKTETLDDIFGKSVTTIGRPAQTFQATPDLKDAALAALGDPNANVPFSNVQAEDPRNIPQDALSRFTDQTDKPKSIQEIERFGTDVVSFETAGAIGGGLLGTPLGAPGVLALSSLGAAAGRFADIKIGFRPGDLSDVALSAAVPVVLHGLVGSAKIASSFSGNLRNLKDADLSIGGKIKTAWSDTAAEGLGKNIIENSHQFQIDRDKQIFDTYDKSVVEYRDNLKKRARIKVDDLNQIERVKAEYRTKLKSTNEGIELYNSMQVEKELASKKNIAKWESKQKRLIDSLKDEVKDTKELNKKIIINQNKKNYHAGKDLEATAGLGKVKVNLNPGNVEHAKLLNKPDLESKTLYKFIKDKYKGKSTFTYTEDELPATTKAITQIGREVEASLIPSQDALAIKTIKNLLSKIRPTTVKKVLVPAEGVGIDDLRSNISILKSMAYNRNNFKLGEFVRAMEKDLFNSQPKFSGEVLTSELAKTLDDDMRLLGTANQIYKREQFIKDVSILVDKHSPVVKGEGETRMLNPSALFKEFSDRQTNVSVNIMNRVSAEEQQSILSIVGKMNRYDTQPIEPIVSKLGVAKEALKQPPAVEKAQLKPLEPKTARTSTINVIPSEQKAPLKPTSSITSEEPTFKGILSKENIGGAGLFTIATSALGVPPKVALGGVIGVASTKATMVTYNKYINWVVARALSNEEGRALINSIVKLDSPVLTDHKKYILAYALGLTYKSYLIETKGFKNQVDKDGLPPSQ